MNDKDLYELCVSSGFATSEWWPTRNNWCLSFFPEREEFHWPGQTYAPCHPVHARARILAGLVEWGTADKRWIKYLSRKVAVVATGPTDQVESVGEPIATLLDCFRRWKESQCKA